jgi:15-cis-phytoene synthase
MALREARHELLLEQQQQKRRQAATTSSSSSSSDGAQPASSRDEQLHHQQQELSSSFPINGDLTSVPVNGQTRYLDESTATSSSSILGINQDVIELVGHELGAFATPQEIQDCAAYLRSKAPPGLLLSASSESSTSAQYTTAQVAKFLRIMDRAYFEAGEVTSAFAKTFYMGTMLLPDKARQAIWAVYVWCRRTDEIVDAPRDDDKQMLRDLSAWEVRLENLFERGIVEDVYDLCLLDCRIQYPAMDIAPYMDMIRGMLMDVPGLGQDRYDKFDELHLYCYRVAGTVGLMSLPIFGCAPGYDDETARCVYMRVIPCGSARYSIYKLDDSPAFILLHVCREPALSLGVAFQLTNILRDVGEDAVKRGRVYLPREDLERFGVTEDQIFEQRVDDRYVNLMRFEIARARMYYERARRGVFMLAPESRLPVQSSLDAYGRILDKIEMNGYDSLTKRAYVDKWEKLSIIPSSWYRTLDISKVLPLPGDKPVLMDRI